MIQLEGQLERITYHNPENHYTIARLTTSPSEKQLTIVGFMTGINPGQNLKVTGTWETHPKYGQQFKIDTFEITLPATVDGIRKYLESDYIKGIGRVMARRLVAKFGVQTLDVIERAPERLAEVKGIGKEKAALIETSWNKNHAARELMLYLQNHGVKTSVCAKILKAYGDNALKILKTDPYRLAEDLPGQGFIIADTITRHSGIPADDPRRVMACILHLVRKAASEGHVFVPEDHLVSNGYKIFGIHSELCQEGLETLAEKDEIVIEPLDEIVETRAVYLKSLYTAETGIAERLKAILSVPVHGKETDPEHLTRQILKKLALKPSIEQLDVLRAIFSHRAVIITGGPGTGKTTLIRSINAVFENEGKKIVLAAPTGRAARRLSEITGRDATTIHRLLGYNFRQDIFEKNQDNPIDANAVIIDETSMVDTILMYHLLKAIPVSAVVILVGDAFQLPSIGPGNLLDDLIKSKRIPVFYLTKIFRQGRQSPIVMNAHKVRNGEIPDLDFNDSDTDLLQEFYFIEQSKPEKVVETVVKLCTESIPDRFGFDPVKGIQVLTPMHKGTAGTINLNRMLQKKLNAGGKEEQKEDTRFNVGDKVMHLKNNYQKEVFNGDIGIIEDVDIHTKDIRVNYYGRTVAYSPEETDELALAYAISVHKSQGSEYSAVIVTLMTQHYPMLQRNLLYTAMTRGQKLVVLVGTKKAFGIALNRENTGKRYSALCERLQKP